MNRFSGRILLLVAAFALLLVPVAALGAGTFDDVASDNVFKGDIDWLASAGVTKGCNPPSNTKFCPEQNVTRQQMAAFMHRLAVNKVVDAKTALTADNADHATRADSAISADELDQKDAATYRTIVGGNGCAGTGCADSTALQMKAYAPVTINAPMSGVLTLNFSLDAENATTANNLLEAWVAVDQTTNGGCGDWFFGPVNSVGNMNNFLWLEPPILAMTASGASVVEVGTGSHTVKVCALSTGGITVQAVGLNATWSAEGSGLSLSSASAGSLGNIDKLKAAFGDATVKFSK